MNLERVTRIAAPGVAALADAVPLLRERAEKHALCSASFARLRQQQDAVAAWHAETVAAVERKDRSLAPIDARLLSQLADALFTASALVGHLAAPGVDAAALEGHAENVSEAVEATRGALRLLGEK